MEDRGADLLDGVVELRHHVAQPLRGSEIALTCRYALHDETGGEEPLDHVIM